MSKSLFEIQDSMMNLLEYNVNDETGEIVETEEEFIELYNSIQVDLNTKLDNTNCLQKMIDGELDVIDKENFVKDEMPRQLDIVMAENMDESARLLQNYNITYF